VHGKHAVVITNAIVWKFEFPFGFWFLQPETTVSVSVFKEEK